MKSNVDYKQGIKGLSCAFIFSLILLSGKSQSIESNGFYIIIDQKKDCPNLRPTLNPKVKHCVSQRPIINASEFESVSSIIHDSINHQKSIVIKLSSNGFNTWKGVLKNFPNAKLALIIDTTIAGTFKNDGQTPYSLIPIRGAENSIEIDWIYEHLKKTSPPEQKD